MTLITDSTFGTAYNRLYHAKRLTVDTETTGLYVWHGARVAGVSVLIPGTRYCYYFPFRHEEGPNLSPPRLAQLMRLLSDPARTYTFWNGKFDIHQMGADGLRTPTVVEDIMLWMHLLNENERFMGGSYELKGSAKRYLDPAADAASLRLTNLLADRGLGKGDIAKLPARLVEPYACDDVRYTEGMREFLLPHLSEWDLTSIAAEVGEYMLATQRMEARGLRLDVPLMRKYEAEAESMAARYERRIHKLAGYKINLRSSKQLQAWLGVPSTAREALEKMRGKAPEALFGYRQWERARSAYYAAYRERMTPDGILHPNIKLHGTVSGRPSAEDPNLQAVPRATEIYKVKDVFIARPGHLLLSADYEQMELRLGAHYAKDEFLIDCFNKGLNPHKMTEEELGIPYFAAKQTNFAVLYGTGISTLAATIGCSEAKAASFLRMAHSLHPNYRPLYDQVEGQARKNGYIRLWTGRVRRFNMPNPEGWFHKALSNLIQGGVAEVMRRAITLMDKQGLSLLLQVHDQVLLEVPTARAKKVAAQVRECMVSGFDQFTVPFAVDIKVGKRWGSLEEMK